MPTISRFHFGAVSLMKTSRSCSGKANGRRKSPLTRLNTATLAAMPSDSISRTSAVAVFCLDMSEARSEGR